MRIGEIQVEPVQPTQTGLYLARRKDGTYTGVGRVLNGAFIFCDGTTGPVGLFDAFGPLRFPEQPDKVHTIYTVEPQWDNRKPRGMIGAPGRT